MADYVTREQMEAEVPGLYEQIAPQFRDTLPAEATAIAQNTDVIRKGFGFIQGYVDRLLTRLKYTEGEPWPFWKLVGAYYAIEADLGSNRVRQVGAQIFSTMPWPPNVRNVVDAFRFMDQAYRFSHGGSDAQRIGGWPVVSVARGKLVIENRTPYPFWVEDGNVTGVCRAFAKNAARAEVLEPGKTKLEGQSVTRYQISFEV